MNLRDETLALRGRYDDEPTHSAHVAALALQLFDLLQGSLDLKGLDGRSRDLLGAAALLHDIGRSQTLDGSGHHKHSARLIREHCWQNLTTDEAALVAQIARYHRKSLPQPGHADFHALSVEAQGRVMLLGGMLRLADALDRTHTQKIARLELSSEKDGTLLIRVEPRGPWEPERAMFAVKRDMLELALGRFVRCEALPARTSP